MHKPALIAHLNALLAAKASSLAHEIASTLEARNSDTKSSAGDKHEVGRAMVQQELDQLEAQLANVQVMQQELASVPLHRVYDRVAFGCLVSTDQGRYFIAIGLGVVEVDGEPCYAISLASPIGQTLMGKGVGEVVSFLGKRITVRELS
ncbi:MAG: 3-oxoacyl-ACP synthase [Flavobacteriales bacterium]|jgi:transcription elongation GreA/GreB family factor